MTPQAYRRASAAANARLKLVTDAIKAAHGDPAKIKWPSMSTASRARCEPNAGAEWHWLSKRLGIAQHQSGRLVWSWRVGPLYWAADHRGAWSLLIGRLGFHKRAKAR